MIPLTVLFFLTSIVFDGTMALRVTSPSKAASWNLQMPNTITWMSGANDPPTFDIVLVNNNPSCAPTGMSQVIKKQVSCSTANIALATSHPSSHVTAISSTFKKQTAMVRLAYGPNHHHSPSPQTLCPRHRQSLCPRHRQSLLPNQRLKLSL
ncbi:hypothetical protein PCASD_13291 [Puccinia coronata f. sp. avenae]|uniref:Plastocyanin-like domain-containing protein n=1 Tax=Puccinia coronata f. sp. avenae TaxID=200324 RepID=A0A2N5U8V0_9BASI|nr:hypothetical protein PCASD_13291 [Puccinia coronata f. sp. avenae]